MVLFLALCIAAVVIIAVVAIRVLLKNKSKGISGFSRLVE